MDAQLFFLIHAIETVRGGVTKALYNRANILASQFERINILTFNFNPDYDAIRQTLRDSGKLKENVVIHNLYEFLANQPQSESPATAISRPIEEEGFTVEPDPKKNAYRLYKDGLYVKYKSYGEGGKLEFIDYFNENRYRTSREWYDSKGRIRKKEYMDFLLNQPRQSLFYDESGHCFLSVWYEPEDGKATRVNWFQQDGVRTFGKMKELKTYWLERIAESESNPIFLSDSRVTDDLLVAVEHPNVAKVVMIHSNHLAAPYTYGAPLAKRNEYALENLSQFDAVVFLTNEQKNDVQRRFGPRTTYNAIGHSARKVEVAPDKREAYTAVVVSRFSKLKNVEAAVRAFRKVADCVPEAKLELWGFGSQKENLSRLIHELKLEKHVFIKGFTINPNGVFERAAFSVMTSKTEGFGLVITESMAAGAPVISFNIKYGPHDVITNGIDGLLIDPNDIEALSDAMIELFTNQEKRRLMGEEARKIADTLSDEKFAQEWLRVFEKASEQKCRRANLGKPQLTLTNVDYHNDEMKLEGTIAFPKGIESLQEDLKLSLYIRERTELIDQYLAAQVEWKDEHAAQFTSIFSLAGLARQFKLEEGKLDVYVSCSLRNDHQFIRLGKGDRGKSIELPSNINHRLSPYITKHGNVSFKIAPEEDGPIKNLLNFFMP